LPLLGRTPWKNDFRHIIDQLNCKLTGWKANHLSSAGRVALAKSVLATVPIYPMMTAVIPKSCIEEMKKMQISFIWGDTETSRRRDAISWDIITQPKCHGGLGIRKLDVMNKACLMKLGRGVYSGENSLWSDVLRGKYQRDTDFVDNVSVRPSDSSL